jgi:exodeoxyribonuclease VII small subunit
MATQTSDEFGKSLARLEEIVTKLEQGNMTLDESVALFREGKGLAQRCQQLLKDAQGAIDAAAADPVPPARSADGGLFGRPDDENHGELPL